MNVWMTFSFLMLSITTLPCNNRCEKGRWLRNSNYFSNQRAVGDRRGPSCRQSVIIAELLVMCPPNPTYTKMRVARRDKSRTKSVYVQQPFCLARPAAFHLSACLLLTSVCFGPRGPAHGHLIFNAVYLPRVRALLSCEAREMMSCLNAHWRRTRCKHLLWGRGNKCNCLRWRAVKSPFYALNERPWAALFSDVLTLV
jgi:hypothetical protein